MTDNDLYFYLLIFVQVIFRNFMSYIFSIVLKNIRRKNDMIYVTERHTENGRSFTRSVYQCKNSKRKKYLLFGNATCPGHRTPSCWIMYNIYQIDNALYNIAKN